MLQSPEYKAIYEDVKRIRESKKKSVTIKEPVLSPKPWTESESETNADVQKGPKPEKKKRVVNKPVRESDYSQEDLKDIAKFMFDFYKQEQRLKTTEELNNEVSEYINRSSKYNPIKLDIESENMPLMFAVHHNLEYSEMLHEIINIRKLVDNFNRRYRSFIKEHKSEQKNTTELYKKKYDLCNTLNVYLDLINRFDESKLAEIFQESFKKCMSGHKLDSDDFMFDEVASIDSDIIKFFGSSNFLR